MKIKLEVEPEDARNYLKDVESRLSEKLRQREELNVEVQKLEASAKNVREQLQGMNGARVRTPRGENRNRIIQYLKTLPIGKAKMTQISKSTGINPASASYTLNHNPRDFVQDKNGLWNLK